jgi:lipopolysaccharide/colanic/teichoic acid biosynthesis glycosyltransferase
LVLTLSRHNNERIEFEPACRTGARMHCLVLLFVDLLLVSVSNLCAVLLSATPKAPMAEMLQALSYSFLTILFALPVLAVTGLNRTLWRFTSLNDCLRIVAAVAIAVSAAMATGFALDVMRGVPDTLPVVQGLLMATALMGTRAAMRLRHTARARRRKLGSGFAVKQEDVLVVGINALAELFLRCVAESGGLSVSVAGILSDVDRHHGRLLRSCRILGRPEAIETVLCNLEVHGIRIGRIVIAASCDTLSATARDALRRVERERGIVIDLLAQHFGVGETAHARPRSDFAAKAAEDRRAAPSLALDMAGLSLRPYIKWKRIFDIAAAIVSTIFLSPLMLLAGIIVAFDVGYPLIFWQQRPGVRGRPIKVLKFRTMRAARDQQGNLLSDDERLSTAGKFLRRTRLDELPQIYNVLVGQMSLVGPRPLLPVDQSSHSIARLGLRPGLTGWAQVNGGRHLSKHDKGALDLWYVKHASFGLDLLILLRTALTILLGERVERRAIDLAWMEFGRETTSQQEVSPRAAAVADPGEGWLESVGFASVSAAQNHPATNLADG